MVVARWDVTDACNLCCVHCRSAAFYSSEKNNRGVGTSKAHDIIWNLASSGVDSLVFLGGEPTLRRDLADLIAYASNLGLRTSVSTNGTTISETRFLRRLVSNLSSLNFSLDGSSSVVNDSIRGVGSFANSIATIRTAANLKDFHFELSVTMVLTSKNFFDVGSMLELVASLGVDSFSIAPLISLGRANTEDGSLHPTKSQIRVALDSFALAYKKVNPSMVVHVLDGNPRLLNYLLDHHGIDLPICSVACEGGKGEIFIQPDGSVYPCQHLTTESAAQNAMNLRVERQFLTDLPLRDIIKSTWFEQAVRLLESHSVSYEHFEPCQGCPHAGLTCHPCPLPNIMLERSARPICQSLEDLR